MGSVERNKEKQEAPNKGTEQSNLVASPKDAHQDHKTLQANDAGQTIAMAQKQMEKGQLTHTEIVHDKAHSDAPKHGATLEDGPNGHKRVSEIKYEDGKSRKFGYDDKGNLTKYQDKEGHTWERDGKDPNQWNQVGGKAHLRGQMIVGRDGEFKFANYDKKYVSHYDANGNEKKDAQREFSSLSIEEKAELRMQGNAFLNTGEPQGETLADKDRQFKDQAMQMVDGVGHAIDGMVNQGIDMMPKEVQGVVRPAEQFIAGIVSESAHLAIGLGNLLSPYRPESDVVKQAEDNFAQTMNEHFGTVPRDDYLGQAIRNTIIRVAGIEATPIGTLGDLGHAIVDPLATATNYYMNKPDIGGDLGRVGEHLKDPRHLGEFGVHAALSVIPAIGVARPIAGGITSAASRVSGVASDVAGAASNVAGKLSSRLTPEPAAADVWRNLNKPKKPE